MHADVKRLTRPLSVALVVLIGVLATLVSTRAAAADIDVRIEPMGEEPITRFRVIASSSSAARTQKLGGGEPVLELTVYAGESGNTKPQLRFRSDRRNDGVRLKPSVSRCVWLQLEWKTPEGMDQRFFLPEARVQVCAGEDNVIALERKLLRLKAVVWPDAVDATTETPSPHHQQADFTRQPSTCVEYQDDGETIVAGCRPVGEVVEWELSRATTKRRKIVIRTATCGRYASNPQTFDLADMIDGKDTVLELEQGPLIVREVELRLPGYASRGWSPPDEDGNVLGQKELTDVFTYVDSGAVDSCPHIPAPPSDEDATPVGEPAPVEPPDDPSSIVNAAAPDSGARRGFGVVTEATAESVPSRCELELDGTRGDTSIFTARCPMGRELEGTEVFTYVGASMLTCEIRDGVCEFPRRPIFRVCLNSAMGAALARDVDVKLQVDRFDERGTTSRDFPIRYPRRRYDVDCPMEAKLDVSEAFGGSSENARFSLSLTGPFTNHPSRNHPLVIAEKGTAAEVFDAPLPASDLKVRTFSLSVRLRSLIGSGFVRDDLSGVFHNGEVGGATHVDFQAVPKKLPIMSVGPFVGLEVVRTRNWIERAPGELDPLGHTRLRRLLGARSEFVLFTFKDLVYRSELHAAWASERDFSAPGRKIDYTVFLVGGSSAVAFGRRVPWLSFHFGYDVLIGSSSELLRYEAAGDFSKHHLRGAKFRPTIGLTWHANMFSSRR